MVEFGDELVLQSLRIPWLIWIQLLVMFLLLLLLYSLTSSSPSDACSSSSSRSASSAAADAPSPSSSPPPPLDARGSHSRKQFLSARGAHQVEESQSVKGFISTSTSRRVAVEEDEIEGENSSHSYVDHHPCSIVRLARIAFLKCLGLDFTSENSSFKRHRR